MSCLPMFSISNRRIFGGEVGAPFRVSELSKNFPPSISLKSEAALGLSVLTGPSAEAGHTVKTTDPAIR